MVNIFFDFDGTIINSQHRLYDLFCELCPECHLIYDEYWNIKRKRITQKEFLKKYFKYSDEKCRLFHQKWLEKVEEEKRLDTDFLVEGILLELKKIKKHNKLILVTNRQSKQLTLKEVTRLQLNTLFDEVLVTEQKSSKSDLISKFGYCHNDFLVGDTGEDILEAKKINLKNVAVSWGILDTDTLKKYSPNVLVERVSDLASQII